MWIPLDIRRDAVLLGGIAEYLPGIISLKPWILVKYVSGCLGDGWGECEGQWGRVRVRIGAIVSDGETERAIVRVSG